MQTGADQIRIRHCRLRLRRTGGWSWGPDPRQLLAAATRALPHLLARELERFLGGDQKNLTIQRLAVRVPVSLGQLLHFGSAGPEGAAALLLSQGIARGLEEALCVQAGITPGAPAPEPEPVRDSAPSREPWPQGQPERDAAAMLVAWYGQGRLIRLLPHFNSVTAAAWERMVLAGQPLRIAGQGLGSAVVEAEALALGRAVGSSQAKVSHGAGRRLVLLAALLERFAGQLTRDQMTRLLDEILPVTGAPAQARKALPEERSFRAPAEEPPGQTESALEQQAPRSGERRPGSPKALPAGLIDVSVPSVLPFLALGVLDRLGYWEALWASLKAADLEGEMGCFGVALAYKLLPAPRRGWLRPAPEQLTAALTGGFREAVATEALEAFARGCAPHLAPADGFLKLLLAEGHDPAWPLLIHKLDHGQGPLWLLLEVQGAFPLGWYADPGQLVEALAPFVGNTLLVSEAATETRLLADLDQRRFRFITSLPPARGEAWRPVDRQRRWWTNDEEVQAGWLLKQCRDLPALTDTAGMIHQALIRHRPALLPEPLEPAGRFERSVALAAASALATLAWQLWGKAQATDPLLALERLGQWEGRVTFDKERVTIRPAVGQRYLDLSRNGLFATAPGIPWLGGRPMEFTGL